MTKRTKAAIDKAIKYLQADGIDIPPELLPVDDTAKKAEVEAVQAELTAHTRDIANPHRVTPGQIGSPKLVIPATPDNIVVFSSMSGSQKDSGVSINQLAPAKHDHEHTHPFPIPVIGSVGGMGDVSGDGPVVDGNLAMYEGTNGKVIMDSGYKATDFQTTLTVGNLTATAPIVFDQTREVIGGAAVVSIPKATALVDGYLAALDFATFNGKQDALAFPLSATLGGTGVNNGANNLTVPATGTAALLATANVFTAVQTIQLANPALAHLQIGGTNHIDFYPPTSEAPNYANIGGTGDRRGIITITTTLSISATPDNWINGSMANESYVNTEAIAGLYIKFVFPNKVLITEATYYQSIANSEMGMWQWQYDVNNDGTWVNIGSPFLWGGASPQTMTELAGHSVLALAYRMLGISGSDNQVSWGTPREFEFKIGNASAAIMQSDTGLSINPTGGNLIVSGYTITVPATLTLAGRNLSNTFTANQIIAQGYTLKTTGIGSGGYEAGLIAQAGGNIQSAIQLNDHTGAIAANIMVRDNHSLKFLTASTDGYYKFSTTGGLGVFVDENLTVYGNILSDSSLALGTTLYATSGNPLTTSPALGTTAFGWNGSNGYSEYTAAHFHLTKDDHTSGHGTLKAVISTNSATLTPVVWSVDHTGWFTHYGGVVVNENGDAAADFRVESDSYDAVFVDASANSIDIMHHASGLIGFFAQTPAAQQTYTAVSNPPTQAEVTAIRDCLVNLGLMKAS